MRDTEQFALDMIDCRKIYNIGTELSLPMKDIRLYSYIYFRTREDGLNCFNEPCEINIEALREMIEFTGDADEELTIRLKLYMDSNFRKEKMIYYIDEILPKIKG